MPRNQREPVKPVESEESGEDDDAESEEESDSEPEPTPAQKPAAKPQQTPTPMQTPTPHPPPSSSSEEDEESGAESESDEEEAKLRQPPSKPVEKPVEKSINGAKNGRSKPSASVPSTPTKAVASKRAASEDVSTPKGSKKVKTNNGETSEKKPASFQRVFSEDDDLVILQEMNGFRSERNSDPLTDSDVFYECIKDKLQADLSNSTQLKSKIKRLRRKYLSNIAKERAGTLKLLSNSRDQKVYELSKLYWENENENGVDGSQKARSFAKKKTPVKKVTATATTEEVKNVKNVAFVVEPKKLNSEDGASMEEIMLKTGRRVYEAGEGIEGEDEWSKLRVDELELYIKQLEVRAAQAKLVLGVIKPQDH